MIRLKDVYRKYESRGIAGINGVSLELIKGEVFALMGPNGSGKTSLINLIAGELKADSGEIKVDSEVRFFSGMEETEDMNVQKYLIKRNNHDIDDDKKIQLARDFADIFEFTFQLRQNLSQLSAGQKQKVALAAELVNRPGLLLLDEPFTHLDPHTRKDILASLFTYIRNQETSVLWVTHEVDEALLFSDRIGLLNFGKFEHIDSPLKIVESPKNLFVAQFLGFENFLPVKLSNHEWVGTFGNISAQNSPQANEAILVIPTSALSFGDEGLTVLVQSIYLKGLEKRAKVQLEEKEYQVSIKRSETGPRPGAKAKLSANLSECFIIPL